MKLWPVVLIALAGCADRPLQPVAIDTSHEACENCRMVVSDIRFAAELIVAGEEPLVFDDIGCLLQYVSEHALPQDARVFVVEHRTGAWIGAERAIYTRTGAATPMGSRIIAHANTASRDADPLAGGGRPVPISAIVGADRGGAE